MSFPNPKGDFPIKYRPNTLNPANTNPSPYTTSTPDTPVQYTPPSSFVEYFSNISPEGAYTMGYEDGYDQGFEDERNGNHHSMHYDDSYVFPKSATIFLRRKF